MPEYCKADAEILKQFGAALGAKREALHISQEKLAERAGLHRTYIADKARLIAGKAFRIVWRQFSPYQRNGAWRIKSKLSGYGASDFCARSFDEGFI